MAQSVERLSSGLRINRAKDDAAGLGIAVALTSQINGVNQGIRNLNDGISMVQTAEGAIAAAQEMGQRIMTLATQGSNGTMGVNERAAIKSEMKQLLAAIDSIGGRTKFSGNGLLNNDARSGTGDYANANSAPPTSTKFTLQASSQTGDTISLAANAFLNIGGFSAATAGPIVIAGSSSASAAGQTTLTLVNTTGLVVGMGVLGMETGTKIASINDGVSVVLNTNIPSGGSAAGTRITFGGNSINGTAVIALASGSNPPQTLVGTNLYRVVSATYLSIGTITAVSGNNVTVSASSVVTWFPDTQMIFSGQLTQVHSATTTDLSLSQSVASTSNDTADFQMVQRASEGYVKALTTQRSLLGAYQNQIEYTVSNVTELSANLDAARSNVQDTDYASETATLTKGQILQQAATAMLAQANQMPNVILSLLK